MSGDKKEKRFQVRNSELHYGKFIVYDIITEEVYRFHNLASAINWAAEENKKVEKSE
tara:strand:- start:490 stop:660 length:171 start_codon:yes stop_codon:yes gene_type:complete